MVFNRISKQDLSSFRYTEFGYVMITGVSLCYSTTICSFGKEEL